MLKRFDGRKLTRPRAAVLLSAAALALAVLRGFVAGAAGTSPAPAPQATPDPNAITFFNNTMADFSATSGEPIVKVDNKDRIFATSPFGVSTTLSLLWRSDDGGRTYRAMGAPVLRDAVTGPGGGDTDVDFDARGRVYYVDLSAACVTAAVSEDGGQSFAPERTNYVTCLSDETVGAVDDRQWVAAFGDGTAYVTWRRFTGTGAIPFFMFKTRDGGLTWDKGRQLGGVTQSGPLKVDKQKRRVVVNGVERDAILLYQIYYSGNDIRMFRVTDLDDGSEPLVEDLRIYSGGSNDISNVFPVLAVDRAGNLYVTYSQNGNTVYLVTSTDRGKTWSQPKRVSTLPGTNIMPWIVAGDPGRAAVVWYRSPLAGNPNSLASEWTIHMAQTLNALDAAPAFQTVQVSQNVIHRGEICTDGTLCDAEGRDRSFLEYPSINMDSKGAAVVVYNDNTNQSEGPYVMLAKQATGPSLLASTGNLGTEPGAVTVSSPAAGANVRTDTLTLEGTHTVPPKNYDRDEAGDAYYKSAGANLPGADLRSVSLKEEGDSLVLTMQVADLSPAAVSAAASASEGKGMLYLTQWDYADQIYWLAAEVFNGQTQFYTGTLGMIRSATSKKFVTYNPDLVKSQQVRGRIEGNTLTVSVPKVLAGSPAAGAPFHTVTGYSLSERAPLVPDGATLPNGPFPAPKTTSLVADPSSLPVMLDASGAATYAAGDGGPRDGGVVEVSFDDPTFNAPRAASLASDLGASRWQLQLPASELAPGAHTAYVRQRIAGRAPSAAASVAFNISDKVERDVTSLVGLEARNTSVLAGAVSYDLLLRNASTQTIFTPLAARVSRLSSASGAVTVANADNGLPGAGASFDYGNSVGGDGALSGGELSGARRLRFNNPSNEPFTAEFQVVGQLPRAAATASATNTSSAGGDAGTSGGGASTNSTSASAGALATAVLCVTYNPLLGTAAVEVLK